MCGIAGYIGERSAVAVVVDQLRRLEYRRARNVPYKEKSAKDVGFNAKEEVSFNRNDAGFNSGRDYGWSLREGTIATPGVGGPSPGSLNPILERGHNDFNSITGGYVYRGPVESLRGQYIFGDFISGNLWSIPISQVSLGSTLGSDRSARSCGSFRGVRGRGGRAVAAPSLTVAAAAPAPLRRTSGRRKHVCSSKGAGRREGGG